MSALRSISGQAVLIKGGTIVRSSGEEKADILIEDGVIQQISSGEDPTPETIDATNLLIFPGLIDCHVHFREPGMEHKGTMASEAAAARAGGVTTVCEMPNTDPPTTSVEAFRDKVERASKISDCDIRFFFGITKKEHLAELKGVLRSDLKDRCCGIKLFLEQSTGDQKVEGGTIEEIFKTCADFDVLLVAHCEDPQINAKHAERILAGGDRDVALHSEMRPPESEERAIDYAIEMAGQNGTKLHIAHLSTAEGIALVRQGKEDGIAVTCEVSPHHLFLSTEDYESLGTLGKMNPPLRPPGHQGALWKGIADGIVDCIATDHAPHLLEEKKVEPPLNAPSGVPGVETMIPLLLSEAAKIPKSKIVELCFENPNRIFSLGKKGIVEGAPADLILVDPREEWEIKGADLHSKCGWTPFEGWKVRGKIIDVL